MKNSFSEVVMIIITCFLFFIYPIYSVVQKEDAIVQAYVNEETTEFVDMIRNNGYLSDDMYSLFQKKILKTNNRYEIKMIHRHKQINPIYSDDGRLQDDVNVIYHNTYEEDILRKIYEEDGIYKMNQGDFISVSIYNTNPTLSSRFQEFFLGTSVQHSICVRYGGMIRDEII